MKLAIYKNLDYNWESPHEAESLMEDSKEYVRITEIKDVNFEPLEEKSIIVKEVEHLDSMIQTVMAAAEVKINELKTKRNDLLAITNESK